MEDFRPAVRACWERRAEAANQAQRSGSKDPGLRKGVTSGKHLDAVAELIVRELVAAGLRPSEVHQGKSGVELPGYYRAEKQWDIVAIRADQLVAAIELKSILGSYGNNMNNRTEEALGNACDLIEAGESGTLGTMPPWLGYVFIMQAEPKSLSPVKVREPHFEVDPVFQGASYTDRAVLLLRRMMHRRIYNSAWFVTGDGSDSLAGIHEPAADLTWSKFRTAVRGRVAEVLA